MQATTKQQRSFQKQTLRLRIETGRAGLALVPIEDCHTAWSSIVSNSEVSCVQPCWIFSILWKLFMFNVFFQGSCSQNRDAMASEFVMYMSTLLHLFRAPLREIKRIIFVGSSNMKNSNSIVQTLNIILKKTNINDDKPCVVFGHAPCCLQLLITVSNVCPLICKCHQMSTSDLRLHLHCTRGTARN